MAPRATAIALCLLAMLALAGCGGDSEEPQTTASAQTPPLYEGLAEPPPKGASVTLKEIYRQFQPPKPNPEVKGSAKAIKKGEATCKGKTPTEIREQFISESDLTEDQEEALSELPRFEANPSPSFPAGQIAALVYQQTLPEEVLASYGFQGCVYQLSLGVKQELAPKNGEGR